MVAEQVATRLVLDGANDEEVTRPVSMVGANSVEVSAVKLEGADAVEIHLQKSNDLENWFDDSLGSLTSGEFRASRGDIGFSWIRMRFVKPSGQKNILSCTVNTSAG